jgi:hypothetical protein
MDQLGQPRDHRPRKSFWARFSEQETGPQKVLVGLAGTVTALATTVGGGYALVRVLNDDTQQVATDISGSPDPSASTETPGESSGESSGGAEPSASPEPTATNTFGITLEPGQTLITQGSKQADAFVHSLVDDPGARTELNVVILSEERLYPRPQWIMRLWYNCQGLPEGDPPGEDLCDSVMLVFDDADPSPTLFKRPLRIEMHGIWADNRPTDKGYGATDLEIYPVPASSS